MAQIVINSNKAVSFDNRLLYPRSEPYRITDNYNNYKRAIQHEKDGLITIIEYFNQYLNDGLQIIDINQSEIKNGNVYQISAFFNLPINAIVMFQIKTGQKTVHAKPTIFITNGPGIIMNLLENPVIEVEGNVEIPSYNRNRNSDKVAETKIYTDLFGVSGGLIVDSTYFSGGNMSNVGSNYSSREEMIFKTNSNYVGFIENISSNDVMTSVKFNWSESG
jgi:hypothetical protein